MRTPVVIHVPEMGSSVAFFAVITWVYPGQQVGIDEVLTNHGWEKLETSVRETPNVCVFSEEQAHAVLIGYEQARADMTETLTKTSRS